MDCDNGFDALSNDGILDIIPPSEYDPFEAKFCASLFWLVFHATEDGGLEDVPSQVTSPIQRLDKDGFVVHPEIVQFLTKGEVYCTVCTRIFPCKVALAGHWSVIQTLSRNGVYVVDGSTDVAVTDSSLEQANPFHQGAHAALMDALMTAYSSQVVNIQRVVQAVRRFSTFSASRELPFDLEDALLLWVNKLSVAVNAKRLKPTPSTPQKLLRNRGQEKKVELRVDKPEETSWSDLPAIDDLLKGLCDGRCLLGILLFYEPTVIKIEDIFLAREVSTEDTIRNLDLFRSLCSQYFCTSVLALKVEDILYGSPSLKVNLVALLAEIFSKCEANGKQADETYRSKTSCSENNPRGGEVNGYDESTRSHSAPITKNAAQFRDKDISLKIQNFVENGSFEEQIPMASETKATNVVVSSVGAAEDTTTVPEEDTVEVHGVVVKLRKKVPRNVQPGGGHEALLSRRMKKTLCSYSQEDLSNDTSTKTSEPEEQFDTKSVELYHENQPTTAQLSNEPNETTFKPMDNIDVESADPKSPIDDLDLDLDALPEAVSPTDLLSPISETTEPGSLGNSSNGSVTSPRDFHSPLTDSKSTEIGHKRFAPPLSQTPRRMNESSSDESSVPRGSYVISSVTHTAESAVAAGLPVVERESLRTSEILRASSEGNLERSSDGMLCKSTYSGLQPKKASNDVGMSKIPIGSSLVGHGFHVPTVDDGQRCISGDNWSRRNDSRFSTFSKNKTSSSKEDLLAAPHSSTREKTATHVGSDATPELNTQGINNPGLNTLGVTNTKNDKTNSNPPITWFVQQKNHSNSPTEDVPRKLESPSHVSQHAPLEPGGGKTTSWMITADEHNSKPVKKGSVESTNKVDPVTRELNLLRLKLAEKQRHIEAQKQRTKEQQEEERKRFGQNVFWFAVGKEKERKDSNGLNSPKEAGLQTKFEQPLPNISKKTFNSSDVEPSSNDTFAILTKQSSLDELPPSMGKLQDRTCSLQALGGLTGNNGDLASSAEPSGGSPKQTTIKHKETFIVPAKQSLSNGNLSEQVVHEFRLSRQALGSQDLLSNIKQTTSRHEALGNSGDLPTHSGRVPVMNYTSRISVPLTYTAVKPVSPNLSDGDGSENSAWNLADVPAGVADGVSNHPSSPTRKCWTSEAASEVELAVSKSNYHIFENGSTSESRIDNSENSGGSSGNHHGAPRTVNAGGTIDICEQRQGTSGNHQDVRWINEGTSDNRQEMFDSRNAGLINEQTYATRGENSGLRKDMPTEISRGVDDQSDFKKVLDSEKMSMHENRGTPEGQRTSPRDFESNGNSPLSETDNDTPKKGLALFIGDQSSVGEDGLTPEQLKKKDRFLKNRQTKIEEDKMKKEAILEKKRRKEDKMKEIQIRREKEEHSRQTRLQEKKQQAEIAKYERQKYELQRKENLKTRTNVMDGVPSGYHGFSLIETVPYGHSPVMSGVVPSGMNNGGSIFTPSPSAFSGFTGVQSYVKPSGKTNRKLIINAISHVCLPGAVNKETKDKCLQMMTESSAQHFVILFREGLKFRGLYSLDLENNQVLKVHGVGPRSITEKMIQRLYKYNSGGKEFSEIPAKSFSLSVDGFTLQKSCWQSSKPSVASKTVSNYKSSSYRPTR